MKRHKFLLLQKAAPGVDPDGVLTPRGQQVAYDYAVRWTADSVRDLTVERQNPGMVGLFYDIRNDPQLAREYASEVIQKSGSSESIVMIRSEIVTVPLNKLQKAGGPFIGPRGGKWADPDHTIPWEEGGGARPAGKPEEGGKEKGKPTKPPQQELFGAQEKTEPAKAVKIEHKRVPLREKPDHEGERGWVPHYEGLPENTQRAYKTPDGQYVPERQKLHDDIISAALEGTTPIPTHQSPVAVVMMGGAASGKTTLVRKHFGAAPGREHVADTARKQNFVMVNADDVKEQLPEYEIATSEPRKTAQDAAKMVHEESSDVSKRLLQTATDQNSPRNIVFDGTGASAAKYSQMVEGLKRKGYHVRLIYSDVANPDEAIGRAISRANRSGRWVPEDIAREAHSMIPQNFEPLTQQVDDYAMYSIETGKPHRQIMTGQGGQHQIHDHQYLAGFRGRAEKLKAEAGARPAPPGAPAPAPSPQGAPPPATAPPAPARPKQQ